MKKNEIVKAIPPVDFDSWNFKKALLRPFNGVWLKMFFLAFHFFHRLARFKTY